MNKTTVENRALKLSVAGTLFMALLGFSFALITGSGAILLDGIYSLVTFAMSLLTLKVAELVRRPDDDHLPVGGDDRLADSRYLYLASRRYEARDPDGVRSDRH